MAPDTDLQNDPHRTRTLRVEGTPLAEASAAMILVHGRGASADSILTLLPALGVPGVAYVAPQAGGDGQWYPYGFMSPTAMNEPGLSSAMRAIARALAAVLAAGIPPERTVLLGFSQGACLVSEFAARNARRYGGLAVLSGGLIGPDDMPRDYAGSLDGTPVFMGCSDVDGHIPATRVRESGEILGRLGGAVDLRLYPGMGHLVNDDELAAVRAMLETLVTS